MTAFDSNRLRARFGRLGPDPVRAVLSVASWPGGHRRRSPAAARAPRLHDCGCLLLQVDGDAVQLQWCSEVRPAHLPIS
jgi:hypothetical protein